MGKTMLMMFGLFDPPTRYDLEALRSAMGTSSAAGGVMLPISMECAMPEEVHFSGKARALMSQKAAMSMERCAAASDALSGRGSRRFWAAAVSVWKRNQLLKPAIAMYASLLPLLQEQDGLGDMLREAPLYILDDVGLIRVPAWLKGGRVEIIPYEGPIGGGRSLFWEYAAREDSRMYGLLPGNIQQLFEGEGAEKNARSNIQPA